MTTLYWLDQITSKQRLLVGDRAFTLSQFKQDGYGVETGFVISSPMLEEFLNLSLAIATVMADFANVDVHDYQALQSFAIHSRQQILTAAFPDDWLSAIFGAASQLSSPLLILRPSVTVTGSTQSDWHELLSTQFCACEAQALSKGIKTAWAELFRAKTVFVLQKNKIELKNIKFALLVQSCHQAIASGITTINASSLSIQATSGYELALQKGEVLADVYQVNRLARQLETQELGNKIIAYRIKNTLDGLERYLLDEATQKKYTLDEQDLNQLIQLSFKLIEKYTSIHLFHWSLAEDNEAKLYLTEVKPYLMAQIISPKSESKLIVQGLAAAPGEAIAKAQVIIGRQKNWQQVLPQKILVLNKITLDWLPLLKKAAGIIVETESITSHGAIIARELGIPAIVGAKRATELIKTGELLLINGDRGEVHLLSSDGIQAKTKSVKHQIEPELFIPNYPISTELLVNISQVESIAQASHLPVDGVGLLRSEFFFLELFQTKSLTAWLHESKSALLAQVYQLIEQVAQAFTPRPIFYRSFHWYALELQSYLSTIQVETKIKQDLFTVELQALLKLRENNYHNVHLLLPFVRSVEEFKHDYQQVAKAGLLTQQSFQVWIMAEVPSVIFLLPEYVEAGVQGISIGTNDLTQFLLGINREQSFISEGLTVKHPAVKKAIRQLIKLATQANIPCSLCGQAPVEYPEIITDLVRWGIKSISVEPKSVIKTYWAIARAEQSLILENARKMSN